MSTTLATQANHPEIRRKFPQDIWKTLNGTDLKVLEEIGFLARLQGKTSTSGAKYCCPSLKYLSKKLGKTFWTISRSISKVSSLGLLDVTHRRKRSGHWQTNFYRLRHWLGWKVAGILANFRLNQDRLRKRANITSLRRENISLRSAPSPVIAQEPLIQAWLNRS